MRHVAGPPETRYARSGDVDVAYQVLGQGQLDLVYAAGWVSNVELVWEERRYARFLSRLASFSRLILFDKRGTGLSGRVSEDRPLTLEERMDDVRCVMDAAGSERAALFGHSEGGNLATLFAATYPERSVALVLFGAFAKRTWSPDYPWAPTAEQRERWLTRVEHDWGREADLSTLAPSVADDAAFAAWFSKFMRHSASPRAAVALGRLNTQIDVRHALPAIRVPTLVLHRAGDRDANVEEGRWIASRIPGAQFVELDGIDHLPWVGDQDAVLDEIETFLTGVRRGSEPDRVLATVLFIDIVGSTERAAALGDRRWKELLEVFYTAVRAELERFRGREIKTTGDGVLATFDGPGRAVRCAVAMRDAAGALGLVIRAGAHTGECELMGDDMAGLAVHIGARIAALAEPGEVLASNTVRDLMVGSGVVFQNRGERELKGVPGKWTILAVDSL